jgi:N-acylneuraminate cytidylyltransferase
VIDDCLSALNINPHSICLLYATALLLRKEHLLQAFEILKDPDIGSVLSIAEFESPIQRAYEIKDNQGIAMVQPEYFGHRSQDLPLRYRDIGLFYWWKKNSLELKKFGMVMPKSCAVDIDTIEDLEVAKALFEYNFKTQADFGWY